jgi:ABC-2 type transport system ATP-binding protein
MTVGLKDVAVRYIVGDFRHMGFKDYIVRKLKGRYNVREFWAVDGVSFELRQGDFLGIVGKNGAGKSTLLKAVSGIIQPTRGELNINGSVAALLELGSGFDDDLTVKENTFLRGALLGYTREFMREMYGDIIGFAELEEFQDRPFKQLSSGMKSRLAFSIACLVRPEILILDEVLSVGDGAFRQKSEDKMKEVIGGGATTLFVSHSLDQTKKLCNKVLWLEKGKQMAFGGTEEVCGMYEEFLKNK